MSGIFKAPSDGYVEVPLLDGEQVVHEQAACVLKNKLSVTGGRIVITNQRLLFRPFDLTRLADLVRQGVDFLPDGLGVFGKVVDKALDYTTAYTDGAAGAIDTSAVASATAGLNAALTHPPSIVLTLANGHAVDIGIVKSAQSPNFLPSNTVARDEVLAMINALLVQNGLQ